MTLQCHYPKLLPVGSGKSKTPKHSVYPLIIWKCLYQQLQLHLLSIAVLDLSETRSGIDFVFILTFLSFIFVQWKHFANGSWAVLNIVLVVNTIRLSENANVKARLQSSNLRVSCSLVFNCKTRLTFCVGLTLNPKHRFLWKILHRV